MLYFVGEGELLHNGINIMKPCKKTAWALKCRIPIWIYRKIRYRSFDLGDVLEGFQALYVDFRVRRRRKRDFPTGTKLWKVRMNLNKGAYGPQKLIFTQEWLEDHARTC